MNSDKMSSLSKKSTQPSFYTRLDVPELDMSPGRDSNFPRTISDPSYINIFSNREASLTCAG